MDRCIPGRCIIYGSVIDTASHTGDGPAEQIVYKCHALRRQTHTALTQHHVVIDQCRSMSDLDPQIFAKPQSFRTFRFQQVFSGKTVIMEQILCHPGALTLPVQPDASGTVMEMIVTDDHIDRCMQLDTANLRPCQIPLIINMIDVIVLNYGKYTAQITDDTGLPAVMDITVPYDM